MISDTGNRKHAEEWRDASVDSYCVGGKDVEHTVVVYFEITFSGFCDSFVENGQAWIYLPNIQRYNVIKQYKEWLIGRLKEDQHILNVSNKLTFKLG